MGEGISDERLQQMFRLQTVNGEFVTKKKTTKKVTKMTTKKKKNKNNKRSSVEPCMVPGQQRCVVPGQQD